MRQPQLAAALSLLVLWTAAIGADAPDKVPDAKAQGKAEKIVKDLFKDDYVKRKPAERLALARKLFQQGVDTSDDPPTRYVLFREAMNLAADAGSLAEGLNAVEELARWFEIAEPALKTDFFEKLSTLLKAPAENRELAQEALLAARDAIRSDQFDVADRALKVAGSAAQKAQNVTLLGRVRARVNEVSTLRQESQKVRPALEVLAKNPKDPEANLTAGKYYAFLKGDWDKGLPLLAQGADAMLKSQAARDLAMPATALDQMQAGDGWYDLAASQGTAARAQLQLQAHHWYTLAAPGLTGLSKAKVDKRLAELEKVVDGHLDRSDLFARLRRAIRRKKFQETKVVGGAFAKHEFQEVPPEGALLIGFELGLGKFVNNDVIHYVRPIYLTAVGEKKGTAFGRIPLKVFTVKARDGYAVGALAIRGGGGLDGLSLTFMKIDKDGLNKDVAYKSSLYGGSGGSLGEVGDGSPIIGICGRRSDDGKYSGLGAVIVQTGPELPGAKKPVRPKRIP
jgi:hypothetical protein